MSRRSLSSMTPAEAEAARNARRARRARRKLLKAQKLGVQVEYDGEGNPQIDRKELRRRGELARAALAVKRTVDAFAEATRLRAEADNVETSVPQLEADYQKHLAAAVVEDDSLSVAEVNALFNIADRYQFRLLGVAVKITSLRSRADEQQAKAEAWAAELPEGALAQAQAERGEGVVA